METTINENAQLSPTAIPELTDEQKEQLVKAVRKNPKHALKLARRPKYFQENNHEIAILKALNSGAGRKMRRNLAKLMMVRWPEFIMLEDVVAEMNVEKLRKGAKLALLERKHQQLREKKVSKSEYFTFQLIMETGMSREEVEEYYDVHVPGMQLNGESNVDDILDSIDEGSIEDWENEEEIDA